MVDQEKWDELAERVIETKLPKDEKTELSPVKKKRAPKKKTNEEPFDELLLEVVFPKDTKDETEKEEESPKAEVSLPDISSVETGRISRSTEPWEATLFLTDSEAADENLTDEMPLQDASSPTQENAQESEEEQKPEAQTEAEAEEEAETSPVMEESTSDAGYIPEEEKTEQPAEEATDLSSPLDTASEIEPVEEELTENSEDGTPLPDEALLYIPEYAEEMPIVSDIPPFPDAPAESPAQQIPADPVEPPVEAEATESGTLPTAEDAPTGKQAQKSKKNEEQEEPERPINTAFDMLELFVFTLVAVLVITTFFFRHSIVDGGSMEGTLYEGEHLILSDFLYEPKAGDIVVCEDYSTPFKKPIIKRVIATEGQRVEIYSASTVYVDGVLLDEPYVLIDGYDDTEYPIIHTVEEDHIFVMGDHRNASSDSRYFGDVSEDSILGRVLIRFYPFDKDKFGKVE